MIAMCNPSPDRTVYAGVRAVPPASVIRGRAEALAVQEYWSPERFEPRPVPAGREQDCYDAFRALFAESVRQRLTGEGDVWSQLSGGLDSSSVVSMAQWLVQRGEVPHGVSGTISWVYRWSTDGDEREYSDAVARHWGVRNEVMLNDWFWEDDGEPPPLTDEPDPEYVTWARERRTVRLIRANGGRVLLTGLGSDQYLPGNMLFFADWIAEGRILEASREMARRAAIGRVSFWELAYKNAVLPLLPAFARHRLVAGAKAPPWVTAGLVARFSVAHSAEVRSYAGPHRKKYAFLIRQDVRCLYRILRRNLFIDEYVDVRHPFLSRPLVEFALRLAPEMCVRPHARKWVLRQAMRGILPDPVRRRVGKGSNFGGVLQSLRHEREQFLAMLADPILAQLGCVDSARIRRGFEQACRTGDQSQAGAIAYTLAVETWLQVRSGRRVAARSNCTSRETTYDRSLTAASSNRRLDAAAI
jgi:asparagine synthase (glutamine-hydrolysing)